MKFFETSVTYFTIMSLPALRTITPVRSLSVDAGTTILTGGILTFIYIYNIK